MGQSYCSLHYHIVYATKYRRPWLSPLLTSRLYAYLGGLVRSQGGEPHIVNGHIDHVHLLVSLRQDLAISDVLRVVKSKSSGWVHRTFPELAEFRWQDGYGAFSICHKHRPDVWRYIERQEEHHRAQSTEEEFVALYERYGVRHDPRRMWD